MDFLFHRRANKESLPARFDFLEIQDVYQDHFSENRDRLNIPEVKLNFLNINYASLLSSEFQQHYDLIISNPPYFFPEHGSLSPSEFKNRCRFFIDSDFKSLISGICNSLTGSGSAYLLLRDMPDHGWNAILQAQSISTRPLTVIGDVRGTQLIRIS